MEGAPENRIASHVPEAWPRGMRAEVAAADVGLSLSTFLRECTDAAKAARKERRLPDFPQPVQLTPGRKVWLKEDLDGWLDRKAGKLPAGDGSEWLASLKAAKERRGKK